MLFQQKHGRNDDKTEFWKHLDDVLEATELLKTSTKLPPIFFGKLCKKWPKLKIKKP